MLVTDAAKQTGAETTSLTVAARLSFQIASVSGGARAVGVR